MVRVGGMKDEPESLKTGTGRSIRGLVRDGVPLRLALLLFQPSGLLTESFMYFQVEIVMIRDIRDLAVLRMATVALQEIVGKKIQHCIQ